MRPHTIPHLGPLELEAALLVAKLSVIELPDRILGVTLVAHVDKGEACSNTGDGAKHTSENIFDWSLLKGLQVRLALRASRNGDNCDTPQHFEGR